MKVYILGFDGKYLKQLFIIETSKNGDVYIWDFPGTDTHTSRHVSGEFHKKSRELGIFQKSEKRSSLKNFKGLEFIQTMGYYIDEKTLTIFNPHRWKKSDGTIVIDIRKYPAKSNINFFIWLIHPDSIKKYFEINSDCDQIFIFKQTIPWVGIGVRKV